MRSRLLRLFCWVDTQCVRLGLPPIPFPGIGRAVGACLSCGLPAREVPMNAAAAYRCACGMPFTIA